MGLGAQGAARLGAPRPPITHGRAIGAIDDGDPIRTLAAGFAVPEALLSELAQAGPARELGGVDLPPVKRITDLDRLANAAPRELAGLRAAAAGTAQELAAATLGTTPGHGLAAAERARDALDDLLAALEEEDQP